MLMEKHSEEQIKHEWERKERKVKELIMRDISALEDNEENIAAVKAMMEEEK